MVKWIGNYDFIAPDGTSFGNKGKAVGHLVAGGGDREDARFITEFSGRRGKCCQARSKAGDHC